MAIVYPTPDPIDLTTSEQTFYTVQSGAKLDNIHLLITNYSSAVRTVTVYGITSGNTASDTYAAAKNRPVPPKDTISVLVRRLDAGGKITALADQANALNLSMQSGTERI